MLTIKELDAILAPDVPVEEATKIIENEVRLFLEDQRASYKTADLANYIYPFTCSEAYDVPPSFIRLKRILNWLARNTMKEYTFKSRDVFYVRGKRMHYTKWRGKLTQPEPEAEKPNMTAVEEYWVKHGGRK